MAKGVKHDDETRCRALAMLAASVGVSEVAGRLGVPKQTVSRWKSEVETDPEYKKLQQKNKARFVDGAWEGIHCASELAVRRLKRAFEHEDAFGKIVEAIDDDEDLSEESRKEIMRKLRKLEVMDMNEISRVISVLYDKQALASDETTENVNNTFTVQFGGDESLKELAE